MALGFMRRHKRYLYVFLWLVVLAFIALYIPAFTDQDGGMAGSPSETVAEVGGVPITVAEFDTQYRSVKQRYEQMYQGRLDPAMLAQMRIEEQVLGSLVEDRLVALEAERLGITVSDEEVLHRMSTSPGLQRDGKFVGAGEIRRLLALRGMTEAQFTEDFRQGILGEKLRALLTDGVMVTPAEVEREYRGRDEQVKLEYVKVEAEPFRAQAAVSDDEVRARFESQKETYRIPEKRLVSYVLVDSAALEPRVTVTDAEIDAYYRERQDDLREPEQLCASHIEVKVKAAPDAKEGHDEAEARKIAQGLLDKVKAGGDFAELARKHSEDAGTASGGGDLRCFGRGSMPPEFDEAAFGMKAGETSELVKSSRGFHIIRVASYQEERVPALSQVKERIRLGLRGQKVQTLTEQKTAAVADALARGKSLEDAARAQELTVQRSAPLARGEPVPPLDNPALLARVFNLKRGDTAPEPFGLGRGSAFVSLLDIQASRVPELKDVQDKVKQDLTTEKAMEAARAKAQELHALAARDGLEKAAAALKLTRKDTALVGRGQALGELGTGAALEEAAYSLEAKALSEPVKVAGGWAVVKVLEKKAFDPAAFAAQKESIETTLRDQKRNQLYRAYLSQVRERFPVTRRPSVIARVVGGGREM